MLSRLALGTAQFGLDYGISNAAGQVPLDEARRIIEFAHNQGILTLDTAISYGNSEDVLGMIGIQDWSAVTKLPAVPEEFLNAPEEWILQHVQGSLRRLRVPALHGLLLHRPNQLFNETGRRIYRTLLELREAGLTAKIGVSVYDPKELDTLYDQGMEVDIVQAPFNGLDRRLESSGWLKRLDEMQVELHARSVFLQGLLLMQRSDRPNYFSKWSEIWSEWEQWLETTGVSPLGAALQFVLSRREVGRVVVGVNSLVHLREIISAVADVLPPIPDSIQSCDPALINPALWNLK